MSPALQGRFLTTEPPVVSNSFTTQWTSPPGFLPMGFPSHQGKSNRGFVLSDADRLARGGAAVPLEAPQTLETTQFQTQLSSALHLLPELPAAVLNTPYTQRLKITFILWRFWRSGVQQWSHGLKSRCQGYVPSGGWSERIHVLADLPASLEAAHIPWLTAPSSTFKAVKIVSPNPASRSHLPLLSFCHFSGPLLLHRAHLDNPGQFFYFKVS